ncbi:hypothetical protein LDL08_06510 [Nonomuraea glycinis]|uniref:hypothetical protein n=1 Tax=Nonomuraea glycinis TaxID=2047744 RepID=UPI00166EA2E9|nr:hypothetical protein [Nonomuraea glycinis]MCA2175834.1 hypothetical protein [Nonomuraea glycinis]
MMKEDVVNAHGVQASMLKLHKACMQHIQQAAESLDPEINKVLHLEADLAAWLDVLSERPEAQQLRSAHQDFGLAFYAAMSGLYRQAFASLRSFLEVTTGATYLSSLEFKRRQWVSGKLDISWTAITSSEDGIYSTAFLREFCPEAIPEQGGMVADLKSSYRRCSEYIHGNVATSQMLPPDISFKKALMEEWLSIATLILGSIIHCLTVRYYKDLSTLQKQAVEASLEDNLSHLASIRTLLGLPLETERSKT